MLWAAAVDSVAFRPSGYHGVNLRVPERLRMSGGRFHRVLRRAPLGLAINWSWMTMVMSFRLILGMLMVLVQRMEIRHLFQVLHQRKSILVVMNRMLRWKIAMIAN